MFSLLNPIPLWARLAAVAALAAALVGYGFVKGLAIGQERIDAMVGKQATEAVRIARARDVVTERVVTKYLPQLARQQVVTETIVNEVTRYVPVNVPDLPGSFRVYYDAAAEGRIPDPARIADAAAVPLEDLARTDAENLGVCRADQLKLRGLQEWINEQLEVK